jgi:endonuclease-3
MVEAANKLRVVTMRLERLYGCPSVKRQAEPLGCLVQTVLSQSTSDLNSGRAYASLRAAFPDWQELAAARPASVENSIRSGGLARQKARTIVRILRLIKKEHGTLSLRFLHRLDPQEAVLWLTSLKGVGLKTASVVLAFACGTDIFAVDTHVARISLRLGLVPRGSSADKIHQLLQPKIKPGKKQSLHLNMIRLGREICLARRPGCGECRLNDLCDYAGQATVKQLAG